MNVIKAALVLRVWKTLQQDLVGGGLVPQGEAHSQLPGVQGLHSDVGIPQAACQGYRVGGKEERCVCP